MIKGIKNQGANRFEKLLEIYLQNKQSDQFNISSSLHLDEDQLSAFVEGTLKEKESISIIKHLINCRSCLKMTKELIYLADTFSEAPQSYVQPSSDTSNFHEFWKSLTEKIMDPLDHAIVAYEDDHERNSNNDLTKNN